MLRDCRQHPRDHVVAQVGFEKLDCWQPLGGEDKERVTGGDRWDYRKISCVCGEG